MHKAIPLAIRCYHNIELLEDLSQSEWDLFIRQARRSNMLGRFHALAEQADLLGSIPEQPKTHLMAAKIEADRVGLAARWEIGQIAKALYRLSVPFIVLKGAAYALNNLAVCRGRVFNDVDILVPKSALKNVEKNLVSHGWMTTHLDAYDQRYYRQWMHELPPMRHLIRKTNLDVHHGLLPDTVQKRPDPALLFESATPISELEDVYVLSPVDMWLHSATHLFQEGEFNNGFRDLADLDQLTREFSQADNFWEELLDRAVALNLTRQLYYALSYARTILATPVPDSVFDSVQAYAPKQPIKLFMDQLFSQAFRPLHHSCDTASGPMARWMLYIRSHAIKMPPHLLLPHLAHKSFVTPYTEWKQNRIKVKNPNLVPNR
ncbi:MAG: nucleotidyltransferase family protein [Sedimenticola sp.]